MQISICEKVNPNLQYIRNDSKAVVVLTISEIFCENEDDRVVFPETCDRKVGSECSYDCTEGYLKAVNASASLLCGSDGSWSEPTDEACQG